MLGCAAIQDRYYEEHRLSQLTVIFVDETTLQRQWSLLTGKAPIRISTFGTPNEPNVLQTVRTIRGFYDYPSNTIYCRKMDFEACGHELHHAVLGLFHRDEWAEMQAVGVPPRPRE